MSFYRLKAERCARLAKDEPDAHRRLKLGTESALWRKIADAEEHLDMLYKTAQDHLNAERLTDVALAREPSHRVAPVKGLDLDDPEARRRFLLGDL
jgi:hypothetical protein